MALRLTGRRQASITMAQSLTDGYIPIAQASSPSELRNVTPTVLEVAEGRRGRTIVESPIWSPIGPLADAAGAERIFAQFFAPEGIEVIDVYGQGLTTAVIDWRVIPNFRAGQGSAKMSAVVTTTLIILGVLTVALLATGWAVRQITVLLFGDEERPGLTNSIAALGIGAVLLLAFSGRQRGST